MTMDEDVAILALPRRIGWFSGMMMIVGMVIGSGIFTAPAVILGYVRSIGMTLIIFLFGSLVAIIGTAAFVELGCIRPFSGGEKEYLQFAFPKLKGSLSFCFTQSMIWLVRPGFCATESIFFGQNIAFAIAQYLPNDNQFKLHQDWAVRGLASICIILVTLIHSLWPSFGIKFQDIICVLKILFLITLVIAGLVVGTGLTSIPPSGNFKSLFAGTSTDPHSYTSALFSASYAFDGWNNLNYSLDELIDPIKTLPKAAFGGVLLTVLLFLASMLSHFAVIPIDAIDTSRTTITAQFFVIIAGQTFGGYIVPVIIALSSLSSASCMAFGASRVILSAGQEGFLPYSSIFAKVSSRETPLHALVLNMLLTLILILAPPSGEIYQFLLAVTEYPEWVFYGLTVTGLLYLRVTCPDLKRPFVSSRILGALFVLVSVALVIVPFVPPSSISSGTSDIPYFLAPLIGALLILACVPWWYIKVYSRRHDEILLRSSLDKNKFQMIHFHRSS